MTVDNKKGVENTVKVIRVIGEEKLVSEELRAKRNEKKNKNIKKVWKCYF